jgi:hypothetical protein
MNAAQMYKWKRSLDQGLKESGGDGAEKLLQPSRPTVL